MKNQSKFARMFKADVQGVILIHDYNYSNLLV